MKHGIKCSYWEKSADTPLKFFIDKAQKLGFDIMELETRMVFERTDSQLTELRKYAQDKGVALTLGSGPAKHLSICDPDESIRNAGIAWRIKLMEKMNKAGIRIIGGGLHAYWPVNFCEGPVDKQGDRARSIESLRKLSRAAAENDVILCLEVLNRYENHILNTAAEAVDFVSEVGSSHVRILLDTFHMNIEEDSVPAAIRTAGPLLAHFHTGESNRRVPGKGHLPWRAICEALVDIGYEGAAVMEPFVRDDGSAAQVIRVWRMLTGGGEEEMDQDAIGALQFFRYIYGNARESRSKLRN